MRLHDWMATNRISGRELARRTKHYDPRGRGITAPTVAGAIGRDASVGTLKTAVLISAATNGEVSPLELLPPRWLGAVKRRAPWLEQGEPAAASG